MNTYRHSFTARCPANERAISYRLTIAAARTIMVEEITAACAELQRGFHEAFADTLYARFGGEQKLTAHHHGVDVETTRP